MTNVSGSGGCVLKTVEFSRGPEIHNVKSFPEAMKHQKQQLKSKIIIFFKKSINPVITSEPMQSPQKQIKVDRVINNISQIVNRKQEENLNVIYGKIKHISLISIHFS